MRILVSNDDGVYSEGIKALAQALRSIADVTIVAPNRERSAASHSLTLHKPLRVIKISNKIYAVDGTPTDAVTLGIFKIMKKPPDIIISGINQGANLGDDVHYSGTVSAAIEGAIAGYPAIAISLMGREKLIFGPAAKFAVKVVKKVYKEGLPPGGVLNINVPNVPANKLKGFEWTKIGKRKYGDIIVEKIDPRGRPYFWIGGDENGFVNIECSDCNAVLSNKISITPLKVDMTDHAYLKKCQSWKF